MNQSKFVLTQFENRNGVTSWRIEGRLHGVRIRKNFKTREEAAAEKATLEIKALQTSAGMRQVATTLSDDQVREAEALFQRMNGKPRPLSFYVDFGLANYRAPEHQKTLVEASTEYLRSKEVEYEQDHICYAQYKRIQWHVSRLVRHFPKKSVAEVSAQDLITYLEGMKNSMKTFNNERGTLGTFFKFCFHRGWVCENPILRVPTFRVRQRKGVARTFTAEQTAKFFEFMETYQEGRFVPYYALCFFAGIRPSVPWGEITKLEASDINLETGLIFIRPEVSKIREPRRIAIQPNLAAWLKAYPLDRYPLIVGDFQKRREKFKDRFNLTYDVMRHTFISMFVGKYRSIGEAAIQAGNSENIIRRHYLDLKGKEESERFFNIVPKHAVSELTQQRPSKESHAA